MVPKYIGQLVRSSLRVKISHSLHTASWYTFKQGSEASRAQDKKFQTKLLLALSLLVKESFFLNYKR